MTDETTNSTPAQPLTMNLLAAHVSIDAPHYKQSRFYNFPNDFDRLFTTPVSHADNYPRHLSALSPAAYFVDLIRLLETHIPNNNLKDRRPDLWELPLDQEHTDELVPFLEIVNNVLATRLTKDATQADGLTEQQKQEARRKLARSLLATATYPCTLPVHLPLLEIRAYLAHFDVELADVYETFQLPLGGDAWVAETLGLSLSEFKALTTSKPGNVAEAYGLPTGTSLDQLHEVATFLQQTGLMPNELAELLSVAHLSLVPDAEPQRIEPLDDSLWDYLNRMIRLSKRLSWSFTDLAVALPSITLVQSDIKSLRQKQTRETAGSWWETDLHDSEIVTSIVLTDESGNGLSEFSVFVSDTKFEPGDTADQLKERAGTWGIPASASANPAAITAVPWIRGRYVRVFYPNKLSKVEIFGRKPAMFARKADWDKGLRELAQVKSLCKKYKLPVDVLRSLVGVMSTTSGFAAGGKSVRDSLFDRVFNTPPFYHPLEAKYSKYQPKGSGGFADSHTEAFVWNSQDEPDAANEKTKKNRGIRTSLLAALHVGNDDLQAILDHLCSDDSEKKLDPTKIKLEVPTLTRLYRLSKTAQVLGMEVPEYLLLLKCINRDAEQQLKSPEVPSLDDLRRVGYWAGWLKDSGLSAYQLDYLTTGKLSDEARHRFDAGPTDEQLATFLPDLKPWLIQPQSFAQGTISTKAVDDIYKALLNAMIIDSDGLCRTTTKPSDVVKALAKSDVLTLSADELKQDLGKTGVLTGTSLDQTVTSIVAQLQVKGILDNALNLAVDTPFDSQTDLSFLQKDPTHLEDTEEKTIATVRNLLVRKSGDIRAISDTVNRYLEQQAQLTVKQLAENFHQDPHLVSSALDYLKSILPAEAKTVTTTGRQGLGLLLYLAKAMNLTADVFGALPKNPSLFSAKSSPSNQSFSIETLRRVHAFSSLVKEFGKQGSAAETTVAQLATFAWDPAGGNSTELSKLSGWEESQLKALQTHLAQLGVPGVNRKDGFNGVSGLTVMQQCFDLAAKLGVDIQTLIRLCPPLPSPAAKKQAALILDDYSAAAHSLLAVIKSKYRTDEWEKVFGPIRDRLNERERDALAALVLQSLRNSDPKKKFDSLQDLSGFLLIDVEMGGCTKASYILEAISCLQIYIERCRMQLEEGISLPPSQLSTVPDTTTKPPEPTNGPKAIPDSLWSWMGHYRIWEANRKVFFYPENYIEPSQRQNATPLFKELQSELLQGDITDEAVTDAYINYFDKLDELANLQIVDAHVASVMNPKTGDDEETLFIVGRTSSEPPIFYLRNAVLDESKQQYRGWTPWEKIELTIPAQEVTALYALNRLYIFWIETKEKKERKEGQAQKTIEKTATIRYSYQKVSGRWLQAQTYSVSNGIKNLTAAWNSGNDDLRPPYSPYSLIGKPAENLEVAEWSIGPSIRNPFRNLALGKSATQSSTAFGGEASRGVDGYTNGDFITHTEFNPNAWWQVDLGASANVNSIVIWNRTNDVSEGAPARLSDYWVFVSDTPFKDSDTPATLSVGPLVWSNHQTAVPSPATTIPAEDFKGRFVRVQLSGTNWLHLAEVQVMGIYGETNLALGKSATQSSTGFGGEASRAVDGNPDGDFNAGSVSHTELTPNAWWQVDLGASAMVNSIVIWNRTDANVRDRLSDYWVFVSDTPFNDSDTPATLTGRPGTWSNHQGSFPNPAAVIQAGGFKGRYVRVQLSGTNWLHLAEVQVLGTFLNGIQGLLRIMPRGEDEYLVRSLDPNVTLQPEYTYQLLTTQTVHQLREQLMNGGLDGLLSIFTQGMCLSLPVESPVPNLPEPFQNFQERKPPPPLDFDAGDPYAIYYREIFFHIPFLIADTLNKNQRFEDARKWFHYIFDPTRPLDDSKDENGMWRFLPFRGHTIDKLKLVLSDEAYHDELAEDAFDPDAIAQTRLGAYEKAVAMKYLDNLLAWGDMLFAQDSWEAINQAALLYVHALNLLGSKPKPQSLSLPSPSLPKIEIGKSNQLPFHEHLLKGFTSTAHSAYTEPFDNLPRLFNLPENDEFAGYWNRTQDCLFKIRHCMNLAGVVRQLALFGAPIDPRQLIQATAGGMDIDSLVAQITVPHYRFSIMLQQAKNLAATVIQLGSALLTALEKKDAEDLNLLRSTQEQAILNLMRSIKERQIDDGAKHLESLGHSLDAAKYRQEHFSGLIDGGYSDAEKANLALDATALALQTSAAPLKGVSIGGHLIPTIFGLADGGMKPGDALMVAGQLAESAAMAAQQGAGMSATIAQLERRREDWELQQSLATYDVQQIQAEIDGATIRQAMMERDLEIHDQSVEQTQARDDFYRRKFGTSDLYQWMAGRLATVYFQTYKLALDVARSAEKAYQYERNTDDTMITSGYWDSLKKGLLAGEGLMLALNQLEKSYLDNHGRELEIEKTISLLKREKNFLSQLKTNGKCTFNLDEKLFDDDFPNHYCRKTKSIAITIPAVVGPYQNINATLRQTNNRVLLKPNTEGRDFLLGKSKVSPSTDILRSDWRPQQQIAISRGVDDSGTFQLDFRDERYLPFEGTGAVSEWELELTEASNGIELLNSISDVIMHLRYTALDGSDGFKGQRN